MDSRLKIIHGDITDQKVEAIINPNNTSLSKQTKLNSIIHKKAGPSLKLECRAVSEASIGDAKITSAYNLYPQYIIHSICPQFQNGISGEIKLLESCYLSCFSRILKLRMRSIAIPVLGVESSFPSKLAIEIALNQTQKFLKKTDLIDRVIFVCKDLDLYKQLLQKFNKEQLQSQKKKIFRNEAEIQSCISQFSILSDTTRINFSDINLNELSNIFHTGPLNTFIKKDLTQVLQYETKINANGDHYYQIDGVEHKVPAPYLPLIHFIFDHFSHSSNLIKLPQQKIFKLLWDYVDDIVSWATNLDTSLYYQSFNIIKGLEKSRVDIYFGIQNLKKNYQSDPLFQEILILPDLIYTLSRLLISRGVNINLKVDILLALIYVISPVDFIPEGLVEHPIAYMDDLAICYLVLDKAIQHYKVHPKILSREWNSSVEKLESIQKDYQKVLQVMDKQLIQLIWSYLQNKIKIIH